MSRLLSVAALAVISTGCGQSAETATSIPGEAASSITGETVAEEVGGGAVRGTIGVSVLTLENPFFREIVDSMTSEALKHRFEIVAVGADQDVERQHAQMREFIGRRVDAIVLTPCDSVKIGPAIRESNAQGIPVFTVDNACTDPEAQVVSHIGNDHEQGGRLAADALGEALASGSKIAILDHPDVEAVTLRTRGFEERIAAITRSSGKQLTVVAKVATNSDRARSAEAMAELMREFPDLAGIFAINDLSALGAREGLEKLGVADRVLIVGFDGLPEARRAIAERRLLATPIQQTGNIGVEVVVAVLRHLRGERIQGQILIPPRLYTQKVARPDGKVK